MMSMFLFASVVFFLLYALINEILDKSESATSLKKKSSFSIDEPDQYTQTAEYEYINRLGMFH